MLGSDTWPWGGGETGSRITDRRRGSAPEAKGVLAGRAGLVFPPRVENLGAASQAGPTKASSTACREVRTQKPTEQPAPGGTGVRGERLALSVADVRSARKGSARRWSKRKARQRACFGASRQQETCRLNTLHPPREARLTGAASRHHGVAGSVPFRAQTQVAGSLPRRGADQRQMTLFPSPSPAASPVFSL